MTAKELLEKARGRLKKPNAWTQGALARDERGEPVEPDSEDAVKWCAHGALDCEAIRAYGSDEVPAGLPSLDFANMENGHPYDVARRVLYRNVKRTPMVTGLMTYNDWHLTDVEDVVRLFDRSIEAVDA